MAVTGYCMARSFLSLHPLALLQQCDERNIDVSVGGGLIHHHPPWLLEIRTPLDT